MTTLLNLDIHDIFLFDQSTKAVTESNTLKELLNFIKFKTKKKVINFCYSSEKDSLHSQLTIKDNFILDAVPKSLIRDGEDNFKQFLKTLKNPFLKSLIINLGNLDQKISELSPADVKLTSVIKSLLSQNEFILFHSPEDGQAPAQIELIKKSIQFEVYKRQRKVVIKAKNRDIWLDISGHIVSKCPESFQYQCIKNPLIQTHEAETKQTNKAEFLKVA